MIASWRAFVHTLTMQAQKTLTRVWLLLPAMALYMPTAFAEDTSGDSGHDGLKSSIQLGFFLLSIFLGITVGSYLEWRHLQSLKLREAAWSHVPAVPLDYRHALEPNETVEKVTFVSGQVVLTDDTARALLGSILSLFGLNLKTYELLMERARREATLRMKESAPEGTHIITNLHYLSGSLDDEEAGSNKEKGATAFYVTAYGSAVQVDRSSVYS
ncbi:MAG: YbjQ family protein [Vampirovibrionales bacterium]